jgi:hypothetical protein
MRRPTVLLAAVPGGRLFDELGCEVGPDAGCAGETRLGDHHGVGGLGAAAVGQQPHAQIAGGVEGVRSAGQLGAGDLDVFTDHARVTRDRVAAGGERRRRKEQGRD